MLKRTGAISLLLGLMIIVAGCAAPVREILSGIQAADLMVGVKAAEKPAQPDEPEAAYIQSVAAFSWSLFREKARDNGNVLISPASVYLALAMTLNGADADTRTAMLKGLSAGNITEDQINKASRDWVTLLMQTSQNTKLSIANSIWYRDDYKVDPDFLQRNANYFAAGAQTLDFSNPTAPDAINNWVKTATKGTIEKIIDKIDRADILYLINAVYFKAEWQTPFGTAFTTDSSFKTPVGKRDIKLMHRSGNMAYLAIEGGNGVLLPYKDNRYAFMAMLPAEGSQPLDLIAGMTAEKWTGLLTSSQVAPVKLSLPKFEVCYEASLVEELKQMGMGLAFDMKNADFSLMSADRSKELYISDVRHKTFCRVNELGTEAAAATSVTMSAGLVADEKTLIFNRPFLYGIVDTITGLPLFLGIMANPAE